MNDKLKEISAVYLPDDIKIEVEEIFEKESKILDYFDEILLKNRNDLK